MIEYIGSSIRYIACGVIHPRTSDSLSVRLLALHDGLQQVINAYHPTEVALEETFVSVNGQSTLKLGQARGAIQLTLSLNNLPVAEYAARLVKKTITGNGAAEKAQMQAMVKMLLPHSDATSADAADALAIAICHAHHRG